MTADLLLAKARPGARARARSLMADRAALAMLAAVAVTLLFFAWTAQSSGPVTLSAPTTPAEASDGVGATRYDDLADAFLHGRLSYRLTPPAQLTALPNPYDPAANAPFRGPSGIHDLSLRNGHLYASWGPTPALTAYLPARLVGHASDALVALAFCALALVAGVASLALLLRRYVPDTPAWMHGLAALVLGFAGLGAFVLRRPAVYEVAVAAGAAFFALGLLAGLAGLLLTMDDDAGSRRRMLGLAGAGLCFGLAMGARPHLALGLLVPLALLMAPGAFGLAPIERVQRTRLLVALGVPFGLCAAALLAYNAARFGSPLDFGQRLQLAGIDQRHEPTVDLARLPAALVGYLVLPFRAQLLFPFLRLAPDSALPSGLDIREPMAGLLVTAPILLMLGAAPFAVRRARPGLRGMLLALSGLGAASVLALSLLVWGISMRYQMDFAGVLLIAALLVWCALATGPSRWGRRAALAAGAVLGLLSIVTGALLSVHGFSDRLRATQPGNYDRLERAAMPFSRALVSLGSGVRVAEIAQPSSFLPAGTGFRLNGPVKVRVLSTSARDATLKVDTDGAPVAPVTVHLAAGVTDVPLAPPTGTAPLVTKLTVLSR